MQVQVEGGRRERLEKRNTHVSTHFERDESVLLAVRDDGLGVVRHRASLPFVVFGNLRFSDAFKLENAAYCRRRSCGRVLREAGGEGSVV
jgi:hypothetical protein